MADWKIICDRAMAKWRPYAKKSAASLGIDELRHLGYGSSIHRSADPSKKTVGPVDKLDVDQDWVVTEDVIERFRETTMQDDGKARQLMDFLVARLDVMQRYRPALLSALGHSDVREDAKLAIIKAAEEHHFDPAINEAVFKLTADQFVDLATMSPLGLLQLIVSFMCSVQTLDMKGDFWPILVAWKGKFLKKKQESLSSEQLAIVQLLSVVSLCPRCSSKDTKQFWRKTRAADEPFQFLIVCNTCNSSAVVD